MRNDAISLGVAGLCYAQIFRATRGRSKRLHLLGVGGILANVSINEDKFNHLNDVFEGEILRSVVKKWIQKSDTAITSSSIIALKTKHSFTSDLSNFQAVLSHIHNRVHILQ